MQLTTLLVPTYTQMLKTLAGWLKKAQAQLPEAAGVTIGSSRLLRSPEPAKAGPLTKR